MRLNRLMTSLVATVMGALFLAPIQSASAAVIASSNNSLTIQSGQLLVFATKSQSFTNPGSALSFTVGGKDKDAPPGADTFFYINNGGQLSVSRFTMTLTLPANSNISSFKRCALNVSFNLDGTCASGVPIGLSNPVSGVPMTLTITLPGNGFYSFQIDQNKSGTISVNTSASLSFVTGSTSNS